MNVRRAMLQLIVPEDSGKETKYRRNAANEYRVEKNIVRRRCACDQILPRDVAQYITQLCRRLTDGAQSHYVASMYEASLCIGPQDEDAQHRMDYFIEGEKVCRVGFCAILGTTDKSLTKHAKRTLDMRKTLLGDARQRPERQTVAPIIDIFFMEQYHGGCRGLG